MTSNIQCRTAGCENAKNGDHAWCGACHIVFVEKLKQRKIDAKVDAKARKAKSKARPCVSPGCDKAPAKGYNMCDACYSRPKECANSACDRDATKGHTLCKACFSCPKPCANSACDREATKGHSMCNACHGMLRGSLGNRRKWHRPNFIKPFIAKPKKRTADEIRAQEEEAAIAKLEKPSAPDAIAFAEPPRESLMIRKQSMMSNIMNSVQHNAHTKVMPFNDSSSINVPAIKRRSSDMHVDEVGELGELLEDVL
jgi:hypothetical protein